MGNDKKCNQCRNIRNRILSPAIMYTTEPLDDGKCNLKCADDKKPNVVITRVAVLISLILLGTLICNFYKG